MVRAMTGRAIITGWKRASLAAMLAYALTLQGVLLALGGAMHVQAAALPETVLCLEAVDGFAPDRPGPADHGSDHTLCCIAGCTAGIGAAGPGPGTAALRARFPVPADSRPAIDMAASVVASSTLPVGSRAPPRLG